jgi:hypothetical protein
MGVISEKVKIPVLSFYDCIVFSTVLPREIKCLYSKAANEYCLTSTEKININISYNIYRIKNAIQISRGSTEQQFLDRFKKDESEFESKRRKFLDKKELDTLNEKYSKFYWFKEKLKGIDIFDELFDIKKIFSAEEICEKLSHYFRSYSSEQFKEMPDFILAIRNRIGACRHRAISFHVLLQSWDIRSHVVSNDRHAWAEVLLYNVKKKQSEWVTYELGGTHATFTLDRECINAILSQKTLPFENRVGSLTSKIQKLNQPKVDFIKPPSSQVDKHSRTVLKNHIEPNSFSQVHKYPRTAPKNDMERNSLFRIEDDDVISFLRVIRKNYSSTYKNIFYIHCPEDFKSLWNVFSIEKNGSTKSQEGPLRILIDEKGLLIVNWSKFDETQKASYMSLLDNPRKINSFSLYSDIETINFIDKNPQELSRSFLSRCTLKTLPKDFLKKEVEPKNSDDSLKRNFYSLPNWKDFLWGKINIEKKRFSFKEGLAFAAIRQKKSLVILNPPEKDEEFDSFIHNFNGLKKVLLNGALMEVPEECIISLEKNSQDEVGVEIIMIEENYKSYSNVYYLNMATYWNFFERMRVTSEGMPEILPGWLNNYDFKKDVIIMTQALPTNYVNYFKKIANDLGLKSLNVSVLNDARTEDGSQEKKFYNVQIYIRLTTLNMS